MPNNWKTYKLGDVVEIKYGKDHKKLGEGKIPCYGTGGIMRFVEKSISEEESVLIPRKGSLNNIYYINEPFWTVDTLFWTKVNSEYVIAKYLYYNLRIVDFASKDVGSAIPSLTTSLLKGLEITLPPLQEQTQIANILTAIDNKIELNLQQNKTLEEMAMTLYKHWFIDFNFPTEQSSPPGEGCPPKADGVVLNATQTNTQPTPTHIKRNAKNYFELPYNPKLKERARALRKAGNLAEVLFWLEVKNKKFKGLDFDRQKIIGNYIVDFYCANVNVVVEVDGSSHDDKQEYDAKRDAYLQSLGLTVIHITDGDVKKNMEYTLRELKAHPAFDLSTLGVGDERVNHHPTFQAPLHRRGTGTAEKFPSGGGVSAGRGGALDLGYRNNGGEMVNSELGMIPKGWEVKSIKDFGVVKTGKTPSKKYPEHFGSEIPFVTPTDFKNYGKHITDASRGVSELGIQKHKNSIVKENSVVVTCIGSDMGKVALSKVRSLTNQQINSLITDFPMFMYCFFKSNYKLLKLLAGDGTTMPIINKTSFENIEIVAPENMVLLEFEARIANWDAQMLLSSQENQTLTKLRDTLLPKLISGEVRVKDIKETVNLLA